MKGSIYVTYHLNCEFNLFGSRNLEIKIYIIATKIQHIEVENP